MIASLHARIERFLWESGPSASPLQRLLLMPARFVYAVGRDLAEGQLTLRAMSLVYTTLLSIVPLLAFSFSVLKGFGAHRQLQPLLYEFLAPLGERGAELTDQVIAFVENVRGDVLGSIGLALLIFTVVSMVQKIEDTFNYIWQVQKSRSLARRFSDYLSVILVGPVLMVAAMGMLAAVNSSAMMQAVVEVQPFGALLGVLSQLAPFVLVVLVFAFIYAFVPNTRVRIGPAMVGAALAGVGWTLGGSLFAQLIVGSTRYAAIYSSFAIAITTLIWLYLSWLILLIGAQVAFYVQHPERLHRGRGQLELSIAQAESAALGLMQRVGCAFRRGEPVDFTMLAEWVGYPARSLEDVTTRLEAGGLLVSTEDECFVPGRDPQTIPLAEILAAVRGADPAGGSPPIAGVLREVRAAESERLAGRSLADLVKTTGGDEDPSVAGDGHPPDQQ